MKHILTSSIKQMYSQEQGKSDSWYSLAEQQQQEGPGTAPANPPAQQQQQPPAQQQQQQQEDDPFKGLPMDNLDDEAKAVIEKARVSYANAVKTQKEIEEKLGRVTNVAQSYQSKADKAEAILRKHNLSLDTPASPQPSPEETKEAALVAEFMKEGMKEEAAKGYAKIFMKGMGVFKPDILREVGGVLGPAVNQLSSLQADRILGSINTNPASQAAFKIPGVLDATRGIVNTMIQTNQPITESSVAAAVQMAIGEVLMKSGGDINALTNLLKPGGAPPQQQSPSIIQQLFGGNLTTSGNFPAPGSNTNGGAPVPANAETARLASAIASEWDRELKRK